MRAVHQLDLPFLHSVVIGSEGAADPYCHWPRIREVHEAGVLLVRPDGYVAWRHRDAVRDDTEAVGRIENALQSILGRTG